MKNHLFFLFLVFALAGCSNYSEEEKKQFDNKIQQFLKTKNWKMSKSDSGVYEEVIQEGNGREIQMGDILICKYTGRLLNGNVFDESKKAVELPLNSLIAGWKEVLIGKKKTELKSDLFVLLTWLMVDRKEKESQKIQY
jgi:FKBP-type peptidyl-prolyl cis-trans isomerase